MKIHHFALAVGVFGASMASLALASDNIIRTQAPIRFVSQQPSTPEVDPEESVATFSITGGALPQAEEGVPYSFDLNSRVVWDKPELARSINWTTSTVLPNGLSLSSSGVISGTPQKGFNGTLTITATSEETSLNTGLGLYVYSDIGDKPAFSGVVTLYRFNNSLENSGTYSLPLATVGSPSFSNDSPVANEASMVFNGSTALKNANAYAFGTGDTSFGAWVKTPGIGRNVISQSRDAQNTGQYQLFIVDGNLIYYDYPNGTTTAGIHAPISGNIWHHVAVTRTGKLIDLYIDGVKVKSTTVSTIATLRSDNGLAIGYDQRDNDEYFNGHMKDVFQMTRALTAREVKWLYKSGEGFPQP
jgi:hypothetical protein